VEASRYDFGRIASTYDGFYDSALGRDIDRAEKRLVAELLPDRGGRLLEIGCGTGHWSTFFSGLGFAVTALDVSDAMLAGARRKHLANVRLLRQDAHHLGVRTAAVRRLAAIAALEFAAAPGRVWEEIDRVLCPGGWLLVGVLNLTSPLGQSKADDEVYRDAAFYTAEALRERLSRLGAPRVDGCAVMDGERVADAQTAAPRWRRLQEGAFLVGAVRKEGK